MVPLRRQRLRRALGRGRGKRCSPSTHNPAINELQGSAIAQGVVQMKDFRVRNRVQGFKALGRSRCKIGRRQLIEPRYKILTIRRRSLSHTLLKKNTWKIVATCVGLGTFGSPLAGSSCDFRRFINDKKIRAQICRPILILKARCMQSTPKHTPIPKWLFSHTYTTGRSQSAAQLNASNTWPSKTFDPQISAVSSLSIHADRSAYAGLHFSSSRAN